MSRIILHIDLNAFFVRCEEIKDPTLENKAVLIGHKGRGGIVSTCSYKAREYGVRSGMPMFQATKLCPEAIVIPGDYSLYSKKSHEFINYVKKVASKIEQASIDECYVDFSEEGKNIQDVEQYLRDFQQGLFKETKLRCSIGVGPTKFLAKMASDMQKPMGLTIIRRKDVHKMLDPLPIESFYGIGKKTAPELRKKGINTIGDLSKRIDSDDPLLKEQLGKFYYAIKDWVNGYGSDVVETEPFNPKSIGNSHTLSHDSNDYDELLDNVIYLVNEVVERVKEAKKVGSTVQITLKDDSFKTINRSLTLKEPTNDLNIIRDAAIKLFDSNYDENKYVRLVGVAMQNLLDPSDVHVQLSIFDDYETIKDECATKLLIAELNRKMKKAVFKTASDSLKGN